MPFLAHAGTGAEVLRFPIGARANGMAGAQTAIADGIDAISCNPACLAKCLNKEASFSCIDGSMDMSVSSILYGQPTQKGYLSGGLICLNGGNFPIYRLNGSVEDVQCQNDWVAVMAYGRQITENGCIGYGLKFITSKLAERETATGCGLDMGWLYRKKGFSAAMAVSNAGIGLKYQKKRDELPLCLRFGMGGEVYAQKSNKLLLTGDLFWYKNEDLRLSAGLEYNYANILFFRTGYHALDNDYTLGLGWKIGGYQLDYAYCPLENLKSAHRMSLKVKSENK
ncbi:PorV/PorQ family protein [Candidatus Desantisbacteria bacterium]|nr:PorV/PorQ family protein [Candidatus Desantisbacteria bacterium]